MNCLCGKDLNRERVKEKGRAELEEERPEDGDERPKQGEKMKSDEKKLTFAEIEKAIPWPEIEEYGPEVIVSIACGGWVPASFLSGRLQIPVVIV